MSDRAIGRLGLLVAIITLIGSFLVPEVRQRFGLAPPREEPDIEYPLEETPLVATQNAEQEQTELAESPASKNDVPERKEPPEQFPRKGRATLAGESYPTIQFTWDGPIWMTKNLNLPVNDSWCYDYDPANCERYGRLYTWAAAKRACAALGSDWRLPTDEEWQQLAKAHGGYYVYSTNKNVGDPKKAYQVLEEGGTSGFSARLGGARYSDGSFAGLGRYGPYWSATERGSGLAWYYNFSSGNEKLARLNYYKSVAHSCRCIQDLSI